MAQTPRRALSQGYILVVDDDPSICDTLTTMLQYKGYRTTVARNGREALAIAREDPPDLVLLDVMMPEVDGLHACRAFKQDPELADVRVLMVTARNGREDVVLALEAGASDYVTKPFFIDELVARIRTNLEVKRYNDDLAAMLRISQAVSSSLDIDRVLYTIVSELAEVVQSDRASLIKIVDHQSGYVVATQDRTIPPATQRTMAQRAGATTIEVRASHVVMMSHPQRVTSIIETAAAATD